MPTGLAFLMGLLRATPLWAETPKLGLCHDADKTVENMFTGSDSALDVHLVASTLDALCSPEIPRTFRYWDGIALVHLEEGEQARRILRRVPASLAVKAEVARAWSFLLERDTDAFSFAKKSLPAESALRLELLSAIPSPDQFRRLALKLPTVQQTFIIESHRRYFAQRSKAPWIAGTLSGILPGAGQVYAGSWEAASVSFVLNAVLIGATIELAHKELYFSAGTVGLAASVFYVGNILNAAEMADRYNHRSSAREREILERHLLPEVWPTPTAEGGQ